MSVSVRPGCVQPARIGEATLQKQTALILGVQATDVPFLWSVFILHNPGLFAGQPLGDPGGPGDTGLGHSGLNTDLESSCRRRTWQVLRQLLRFLSRIGSVDWK